jgi:co-chaperonin GroES (HSP10)
MKHTVLGRRVLLKIEKAGSTYEGSIIARPENKEDMDTAIKTIGEVVQLGSEAYKRTETGEPWVKVGDKVHFARYGAVRLATTKEETHEYWVINDIDILTIEAKENV